jgi:DNA-directed RNA polymerase subunit RPC12/RpoP
VVGEYISFGGLETGQHLSTGRVSAGRAYHASLRVPHCDRCKKDVTLILSLGARERGDYKCPGCGDKKLEPPKGAFFSQTFMKA